MGDGIEYLVIVLVLKTYFSHYYHYFFHGQIMIMMMISLNTWTERTQYSLKRNEESETDLSSIHTLVDITASCYSEKNRKPRQCGHFIFRH